MWLFTPGWISHRNKLLQSASHNIVFTPVWTWLMALPSFQTAVLYLCFKQLCVHLGGSDSFVSIHLFWEVWRPGWVWQLCFQTAVLGGLTPRVGLTALFPAVLGGLTPRVGLTALFPNSCFGRSDIQGGSGSFVLNGWPLYFNQLTSLCQTADVSIPNSWHLIFTHLCVCSAWSDIIYMLYSTAAYTPGRVRYICVSHGRTEGCIVYALHHVRLRVGWNLFYVPVITAAWFSTFVSLSLFWA